MKNSFFRLCFALIVCILAVNNWSIPLWDQDESAYAGFAFNMIETGNWLIPDFMWSEIHRKPPLHFWNIAWSYLVFGVNEFAVRFPSVLAILGTYLLVLTQARKIVPADAAKWSVLVLGSTFFVPTLAKVSITDATVLFSCTLCAFGLINALERPTWKWTLLLWLGVAIGVLAKGPPVIIFTGIFAMLLFIFHPNRFRLLKTYPWFFLPLALLPAVIWGYLTYLQDGGAFLRWMYDWYVLKRISGHVLGQTGPPGAHLVLILLFFLPSLMYIPKALLGALKGWYNKNPSKIILACWFLAGWLLYEFSPSKLPAYVVAAHVPLAILIGSVIHEFSAAENRPHPAIAIAHYILNILLGAAFITVPFFVELPGAAAALISGLGAFYLAGISLQLWRFRKADFFQIQIACTISFVLLAWLIAPAITPLISSSKQVAEYVLPRTKENTSVFIGNSFGRQPSLPFYLVSKGRQVEEISSAEILFEKKQALPGSCFVLTKGQADYFHSRDTSAHFHRISSFVVDRQGRTDYYIYVR